MKKSSTSLMLGFLCLALTHVYAEEALVEVAPPAKLEVAFEDFATLRFSAAANADGDDIVVLMTEVRRYDADSNAVYLGAFDSIGPDVAAGGTVKKTTVLYVGKAGNDISVTGLKLNQNTVYYLGALSKNADKAYSKVTADAEPLLTPATFPFNANIGKNFSPDVETPFPWEPYAKSEKFKVIREKTSWSETISVQTTFDSNSDARQEAFFYLPALDFPKDSNVAFYFSCANFPTANMAVGDSLCIEASKDGGATYNIIGDNRNMPTLANARIIIDNYLGERVHLRVRVVRQNPAPWNLKLTSITANHMVFCSNPGKPNAGGVYGSTVEAKWSSGNNNETEWNLSLAPVPAGGGELAWSAPQRVEARNYFLTGLKDSEIYNVRVQAICGKHVSEWVQGTVQAGRVVPFVEDFDVWKIEKKYVMFQGYVDVPVLPDFWKAGFETSKTEFPDKWTLSAGSNNRFEALKYKSLESCTKESADGSVAYDLNWKEGGKPNWLSTPFLNLDKRTAMTFKMAYGKFEDGEFTAVTGDDIKPEHKVLLMVSTDTGKTVNTQKPLMTWDGEALAALYAGEEITVELPAYTGSIISVVFGILGTDGSEEHAYMLYIDDVRFDRTLPVVSGLERKMLTWNAATIAWSADAEVSEWLVKLESEILAESRIHTTAASEYTLVDLLPETDYKVSVSFLYEKDGRIDTAEWQALTFTTWDRPACPMPANLRVEEVTPTSAALLWDVDDDDDIEGCLLRYGMAAETRWDSVKDLKTNTYTFTDLLPATAYVVAVKTVCAGLHYADDWTELNFKTLEVSDPDTLPTPPDSIPVTPPSDTIPTPPSDTTVANENLSVMDGLYVVAAQGRLQIMNPAAVRIDGIRIFDVNGSRIAEYGLKSREHIVLTPPVRRRITVVEVKSAGHFHRFKVYLP